MAQEALITDYFYGDESEQFSYFRVPRLLITSPRFKGLSTDAKLLYGIRNIRAYLLTTLYNAPLTMGPYYSAAVRHDTG